jgi:hypothetical protein
MEWKDTGKIADSITTKYKGLNTKIILLTSLFFLYYYYSIILNRYISQNLLHGRQQRHHIF